MASLGISGDVIDECLNHIIESRVRRTHIRDRREAEQKRAFDALGVRLQALTAAKEAGSPGGQKRKVRALLPAALSADAPQRRAELGGRHASDRKVIGVAVE